MCRLRLHLLFQSQRVLVIADGHGERRDGLLGTTGGQKGAAPISLGVSFVRVVPVRENRSLLSEGRDREPDQAPDQAQAAEKTDGPAKGEPGEPPA